MAQIQHVQRPTTVRYEPRDNFTTEEYTAVGSATVPRTTIAARIVWLIAGVIMSLLAFRFVLALLGANRENAFADMVFTLSYPFAAPFFGLFGYTASYGASRFEFETLVAIGVYALIAALVSRLLTIRNRERV